MPAGFHFFITRLGGEQVDERDGVDVVFANDPAEAERFIVSKRITESFSYKYCGFIDSGSVELKLGEQTRERRCALTVAAAVRYAKKEYDALFTPNEKATLERAACKISDQFLAQL